jgi:hypothetical protein
MAKRKRTNAERLTDLPLIESMSLAGRTQKEIAGFINVNRKYTVTQQMVSYDMKALQKIWAEASVVDIATEKGKVKRHLELLIGIAREAWERSIRTNITKTKRATMITETSKEEIGDVRFLTEYRALVKQYSELFGLDAVKKLDVMSGGETMVNVNVVWDDSGTDSNG